VELMKLAERTGQNVVGLRRDDVYSCIQKFVGKKSFSHNTKIAYQRYIAEFYMWHCNKHISELDEVDVKVTLKDLELYQEFLTDRYGNASVNQKMACLKSLYDSLRGYGCDVEPEAFVNLERLNEHSSKSCGLLTWDEVEALIALAINTRKGLEKALLIELAAKTGFRLNALLELRWNNFVRINGVYEVRTVDKDKMHVKSIHGEFYDRLSVLKKEGCTDSSKVFGLNTKTCARMMRELCEQLGISKDRNITFHSLKKCSMEEVKMMTGDLLRAAHQGNHSPYTTLKYYLKNQNSDPSKFDCLLIGNKIDLSVLDGLSREELLKLIKSADRATQIKLVGIIGIS